MQILFADRHTK